ncbi:molybdopterin-guanine dinucleotide biosynthesis protein B [Methylobacter sp.]|uniref:molybdopterin-guanine dinucleotide biosynthesis protein B n=1 Tax=Methylobacter sp. TaxID=2051955 RepID=UPI0024878114|nr:molybdopterin-guanine dinucleotide biosynthesis protein B [Methylobacter sp.]MDI1278395.1 molybdopterin-guanine dinucleotide biosynthesis protein B [Methylobacter sp.]MDI1359178.1 molybdopterin-guanine dinucleotide biosynthesis protein B [Methylobacter sp.]
MQNAQIPILGFVAASGTGKTTLLTELIPILKQSGLRIGLIKHSHHDFEIDQPGKDSFRLREAGASSVMLVSRYRRAIITEFAPEKEPRLDEQLKQFDQSELDLILVEGFRAEQFPKIELHRPSLEKTLLYPNDPDIIAIATDAALETPDYLVQLELNRPEMIAAFIQNHVMKSHD